MQSAVGIASFPGVFCWSYSSHIKLLVKRVALSGFMVTKLLATTEWLEYELSPKVWSEKSKDAETSRRVYSIDRRDCHSHELGPTEYSHTHIQYIYTRRAETMGHRILGEVTRKRMKVLLLTSIQMIFPCSTCTHCLLFVISPSAAWWGLHLLLSLCLQRLPLQSLMTAMSTRESTASSLSSEHP